jgi:hypothetical protein
MIVVTMIVTMIVVTMINKGILTDFSQHILIS